MKTIKQNLPTLKDMLKEAEIFWSKFGVYSQITKKDYFDYVKKSYNDFVKKSKKEQDAIVKHQQVLAQVTIDQIDKRLHGTENKNVVQGSKKDKAVNDKEIKMNTLDILDQLEAENSSNGKLAILKANVENKELKELLDIALNSQRRYWIKVWNMPKFIYTNNIAKSHNYCDFIILVNDLANGIVSGNKAISRVESFFKLCDEQEQKWYSKILVKDLRAGFTIKTANEAGFKIPVFEVMLATDAKKCKNIETICQKGVLVSRKLDGYRCLSIIDNGRVTLYSRNGNIFNNFEHIEKELSKLFPTGQYVFDGEIMGDSTGEAGFTSIQKAAFSDTRENKDKTIVYNVFDYILYDEWIKDNFAYPAYVRYNYLLELFNNGKFDDLISDNNVSKYPINLKSNIIRPVEHVIVYSYEECLELEQAFIAQGYEGAMICSINESYYKGRKSNRLMKLKTAESWDCEIVDFIEGEGRLVGSLGKCKVKQENGLIGEVGGGFEDALRLDIWNNKAKYVGRIIEAKYNGITKDGYMRFPRFVRFRDIAIKKGEKI